MKILLVSEYFPAHQGSFSGGVEARAYHISKHLAKKHHVTVITSWRSGLPRSEVLSGIEVLRVGPSHPYSNSAGYVSRLRFAIEAYKTGKASDADLVDGQNFTSYLPAYYIGKKIGKPAIATYHETWVGSWLKNKGIGGLPYEFYERFLLRHRFDHVVSVSNFTKDRLSENGLARKDISVIPNGIDPELYRPDNKKFSRPTVCFVGRLVKTKQVHLLLNALAAARKKIPGLQTKLIGKGPEMDNLKRQAAHLGLDAEFLGFMPEHSRVLETISKSHLLCNPSIAEGFGIILIEAAALGVPYVCSDIPVFREVTKGRGGLFFTNEKELPAKIISLLQDKDLYKKKTDELPGLARRYDWKRMAGMTEKLYQQFI